MLCLMPDARATGVLVAAALMLAACATHGPAPARDSGAIPSPGPTNPAGPESASPATASPAPRLATPLEAAGDALPTPQRWYGSAVMYEVMVRSFADSDGDGIGDLRGLTAKLDYLNTGVPGTTSDLKVTGLWLMPFFKSPSYHGYDATDYYAIDPAYGTLEDFHGFVAEAHRRGIKVLLDLVLNHTSNRHPWFQKAARSDDPEARSWYVWGSDDPGWVRPWGGGPVWHRRGPNFFYGLFWEGMPDLNYAHPPVQEEMIKIGKHWLQQGADGYRLDAIRYLFEEGKDRQADLPSTHAYLKRFAREMRSVKPEVALVGEVWTDTEIVKTYYGDGDELDLCFGFDESGALIQSVLSGSPEPLVGALARVAEAYPERRFSAPFLTNHDMPRLASLLNDDEKKLKLAASLLLSLPGTPFLYQGEEIGLTNGPRPGDEGKRTPMQWDATPSAGFTSASSPWNPLAGQQEKRSVLAQQGNPDSLLTHYQRLIHRRHRSAALSSGDLLQVEAGQDTQAGALSWIRVAKGELVVNAFNLSDRTLPPRTLEVLDETLARSGRSRSGTMATPGAPTARSPKEATLIPEIHADSHAPLRVEIPALPPFEALWLTL